MSQTRKKGKTKKKKGDRSVPVRKIGLGLFLLSFFSITSLGFIGRLASLFVKFFVGDVYIPVSILVGLWSVFMLVTKKAKPFTNRRMIGLSLTLLGSVLLLHGRLFGPIMNPELNILSATWRFFYEDVKVGAGNVSPALGGGMIGAFLYTGTFFLFAQAGTYISAVLLIAWGIVWTFNLPIVEMYRTLRTSLHESVKEFRARQKKKRPRRSLKKQEAKQKPEIIHDTTHVSDYSHGKESLEPKELGQTELMIDHFDRARPTVPDTVEDTDETEPDLAFDTALSTENKEYQLPPMSLLDKRTPTDQSNEYKIIQKNVEKLEETFQSFGVDAKVIKANLGPAVTKYEIQPATGVKVSKIVGLTDDIALALAAKDIRMEAPIPGKALIGIEVPNTKVSMVSFRDIVEGHTPDSERLLEVPLGRDISGSVALADLARMPHLLVAGATGSGKSVCINGIITSLLMRARPSEVKLMMIDPKMVELNIYNGIPHLLTPVVTNPKKAAQALQKVVQEMERRYELFAASGARNITGYNEQVAEANRTKKEARTPLPFIVVIVDELADLMMVASNEVEDAIIRLAQMARAAGIHMILATQRPSVDVITGIIKANVPSRIAFAVSSGTDSRTILDGNGAEKLLGRGDMLFQPMGQNKPTRVQGAFISDEEVEAVVAFVKNQQEPSYVEEMIPTDEPSKQVDEPEDELFHDAVEMIVDMQTASISLLQRRFRIGYNRAARMIDEMEMRGIVGPSEGSKPRVVNLQKQEETPQE